MRSACQMARWPIVARSDSQVWHGHATRARVAPAARRQLLAATRECVGLLRGGEFLLVFPEGYPNIDPGFTPKVDDGAFLPFEPGFLRFVALAEQDGMTRVPIVPVGLEYQRRRSLARHRPFRTPGVAFPGCGFSRPDRRDRGAGAATFGSGVRTRRR